jgi:hypothetical protein
VCEFLLRKKKRVRRLFRFPPFTFLCVCLFSSSSGAQHTHSSVHCCSVCVCPWSSIDQYLGDKQLSFFLFLLLLFLLRSQRELTGTVRDLIIPKTHTQQRVGRPWSFFCAYMYVSEPGIKKKNLKGKKKRINDSNRSWPATIKS